ncbi:hypothetical protein [Roseateles chitinivorans]|uniref:hypothetical protein n=1 Tax=Roseateles chitinivorans TaxID=2917965 RepID=UPI003D66F476
MSDRPGSGALLPAALCLFLLLPAASHAADAPAPAPKGKRPANNCAIAWRTV